MSAQSLNIMLVDLFRSETELAQYQKDPEVILANYDVTDEERTRLKDPDWGWLYTHGIHPYILVQFALAMGVEIPQYVQQVKAAAG
ncbi:MAG: hypothetical protein OXC18_06065 [Desulfurellaceae bacterium]|nr:hypothetical protein [Desulfurellaceae bacterium]